MERLTERLNDELNGIWVKDHDYISAAKKLAAYEDSGLTPEQIREMDRMYMEQAKELLEYKNAEKKGLLRRFPCKVGDTLYFIGTECDICEDDYDHCRCYCELEHKKIKVLTTKARQFCITERGVYVTDTDAIYASYKHSFDKKKFGKTVFLTQDEAEEALRRMEDKHE